MMYIDSIMNVSDYILKFLAEKSKKCFTITGGAICFLMDAFSRNNKIKYTPVAHEQAAAMMADSYSRLGPIFQQLWLRRVRSNKFANRNSMFMV